MESVTFGRLVAHARRTTGMTAAEWDYSLAVNDNRALQALDGACYVVANRGTPDNTPLMERHERGMELWRSIRPDIDRMIAEAKTRRFVGWSDASTGPVRYADKKEETNG